MFFLIGVAGVMMASNRVRFDLVAIIVVVGLILSGTLTVDQALAGFGSPVVIMVAALLVIGEMLDRTGVAHAIGNQILKYGGSDEKKLLILLMIGAALLGCVMSSTAIVAIFIPIILRIASNTGLSQSRLLLPMSYAALISGMLTLIATPPNLVVSDGLAEAGYEPLGFFSFFPIGAAVLVAAILYMLTIGGGILGRQADDIEGEPTDGPNPLRARTGIELLEAYDLMDKFFVFRVVQDIGDDAAEIFGKIDARILARQRPSKNTSVDPFVIDMHLLPGDYMLANGEPSEVEKVNQHPSFEVLGLGTDEIQRLASWEDGIGVADILIHPDSKTIGQTVRELSFRETYGVEVLGLLRGGELLEEPFDSELRAGDQMMIVGDWYWVDALTDKNHDFVLLHMPKDREEEPPAIHKYMTAIAILAAMVALSVTGIVPVVVAVLISATAAVLFGTISANRAYDAIHWSSIVLVAGMLPLAVALEQTGGADFVVDALLAVAGESAPTLMMALLFGITAVLGLVLSNTATAVLLAPIAIRSAEYLEVSPYPFAICVLMAASAAFSTPVSTPVVTLVVAPGGYKFIDFIKIGVPLTVLVGIITVFLTPIFFPL